MKGMFAPPASAVPAGEAGEERSVAAALPEAATMGCASALRITEAPPVLVAVSVTQIFCWPAETCVGVAAMERESAPEVCTVTGAADAGAGAMALPLLPSLPVAVAEKTMVPEPPTFQVQVKLFETPPGTTVPAVPAGGAAAVARAAAPGATLGGRRARRAPAGPPRGLPRSGGGGPWRPAAAR